jgi:hypothetical protein
MFGQQRFSAVFLSKLGLDSFSLLPRLIAQLASENFPSRTGKNFMQWVNRLCKKILSTHLLGTSSIIMTPESIYQSTRERIRELTGRTSSQIFVIGNLTLYPFAHTVFECGFFSCRSYTVRSGMYDIGSESTVEWGKAEQKDTTCLGNSVASSTLTTPITATSEISGCVNNKLSNSAGGTGIRMDINSVSPFQNDTLDHENHHTLVSLQGSRQ